METNADRARARERPGEYEGRRGAAAHTLASDAFGLAAMLLMNNAAMVIGFAISGPMTDLFDPRRTVIGSSLAVAAVSLAYQLLQASI